MTTIASGTATINLAVGETCKFVSSGEAYVDVAGSTESFRLTGPSNEKILGNYSVPTSLTIRVVTGSVEYNVTGKPSAVNISRTLTQADNGKTLDCAASVVLTIPPGLTNFGFACRPAGVQIACGAGVTINGASSTVTTTARVGAINPTGTTNAYDVVGV